MSLSRNSNGAAKHSILVVDDEPTLRLGFSYALADSAHSVESAASGSEALDRLASRSYDLVILDLRMPGLDGIAVIDALRETGNQVPVILCSSVLSPRIIERAIRHGVVDFLLKPILPRDLREAAAAVLTPGRFPHYGFWKSARRRNLPAAIQILEQEKTLEPRMNAWLMKLRALCSSSEETASVSTASMESAAISLLPWNAR